jgi:uncharacterized protein YutE (UPF0331/DUF86 family)
MPVKPDETVISKGAVIEHSIRRIQEEYHADPTLASVTHMDALILNVERACQAAIDLAALIAANQKIGIPDSREDTFESLHRVGILPTDLVHRLKTMMKFCEIAIHQHQEIETDILHHIAMEGWKDFIEFCATIGLQIDPGSSLHSGIAP